MNPPHSRPPEGDKLGAGPAALRWVRGGVIALLAYGMPAVLFAVDYEYSGPIVRLAPFLAWTAAGMAMACYGAAFRASSASAFFGGVAGALVAAGVLLFGAVGLVYLAMVLVMPLEAIGALGVGILAAAIAYGVWLVRIRRAVPRDGAWGWGLIAGAIGIICLPVLAQNIHERQFERRLAGLAAPDADTRSQALRSLQDSRFCWARCVRAVCEARDKLDGAMVRAVLGTDDVETACDDPGMSEWPG